MAVSIITSALIPSDMNLWTYNDPSRDTGPQTGTTIQIDKLHTPKFILGSKIHFGKGINKYVKETGLFCSFISDNWIMIMMGLGSSLYCFKS